MVVTVDVFVDLHGVAVALVVVVVFSNVVESLTLRFLCRVHLLGTFQQFPQSFTYIFVWPKVQ